MNDPVPGHSPDQRFFGMFLRGRVELFAPEGTDAIELVVDPEGSHFCVMNHQDARDLSCLLEAAAMRIWHSFADKSDPRLGAVKTFEFDEAHGIARWPIGTEWLELQRNPLQPHVRIGREKRLELRVPVSAAVEMLQVLRFWAGEPGADGAGHSASHEKS